MVCEHITAAPAILFNDNNRAPMILLNDNNRVQNKYHIDHNDGAKRLKIDGIQRRYLSFDQLPVGYRFIPTDLELMNFLKNKVLFRKGLVLNPIQEIEATQFYSKEPKHLERNSPVETKDMYYFIHHTEDSYKPFASTRIVGDGIGCWKSNGDPAEYICRSSHHYEIVSCGNDYKLSYIYFRGKPPVGNELPQLKKTAWVMDEYHLSQEYYSQSSPKMEGKWVLGRIQCGNKNAYENF